MSLFFDDLSITCKASRDIFTSSKRDRNDAAAVMQINFTELKSEINASIKGEKVLISCRCYINQKISLCVVTYYTVL